MSDREYLEDCITSLKHIAEGYNNYAFECIDMQLKNDFIAILKDEQMINTLLTEQMKANGWCNQEYSQPQQMCQLKEKYDAFKNSSGF
jgi:hypothetical protein